MDYEKLLLQIRALPPAQQNTVSDFIEFLLSRYVSEPRKHTTLAESPLAELIKNPLQADDYQPVSRGES